VHVVAAGLRQVCALHNGDWWGTVQPFVSYVGEVGGRAYCMNLITSTRTDLSIRRSTIMLILDSSLQTALRHNPVNIVLDGNGNFRPRSVQVD
jgi:hypothetical protein